jgi:hypothetical protein
MIKLRIDVEGPLAGTGKDKRYIPSDNEMIIDHLRSLAVAGRIILN